MRSSTLVLIVVPLAVWGCDPNAALTQPTADVGVRDVETHAAAQSADVARERAAGTGMAALDALAWTERVALEQALVADDARYAPRMDEGGPVLETPGSVTATFTGSGAHLTIGGRETTLQVVALGRGRGLRTLDAGARVEVAGAEVRSSRSTGVVEWWRSLPSGLEHGVTIAERPSGAGELRVEVAVRGELSARSVSDDAVELRDAGGERVATYAHLVVLDAAGAPVPARMSVDGERIVLAIDDAAARYPLVVDPLVTAQEATLLAPDGAASERFGWSVAFTSDGSRALVGAPYDDTAAGFDVGSARVFLRTGTAWAQEATLLAPDGATLDYFGTSVVLTSDGSRALVGAVGDDTAGGADAGSARVFLRTGTTWAQEATLLAPDGVANDRFGGSVALTADGSRALVGATGDDTASVLEAGSARVFLRTGTAWAQEATLLAPDGAVGDELGISVALTPDGSRALVGSHWDDTAGGSNAGSARVFLRTGTAWAQEATLLAADGAGGDELGISVALTPDGSRALVGAHLDDTAAGGDAGSARVFVRTGTAWTQEATLLAPDGAGGDELGISVALTSDGSHALLGAYWDDTVGGADAGSARVFTIALAPNGSSCGGDAACVSGFCTDGVCCSTRCAGGANDCQACSAALTGGTDGICASLSATAAPSVTCRAPAGPCDVAETCTSTSTACPPDAFAPASTVCRAAATVCDVADTCSGASAACPFDTVAAAGTICRAVATVCDRAETCDGVSTACPAVDSPALGGTTCRASTGACDAAEVCDGAAFTCPGDALTPAGVACGGSGAGSCSTAGTCSGLSAACPGATLFAAGTLCLSAIAGDPCDVDDFCDGITDACQPRFAAAGTVCDTTVSDVCDAPDVCAGTSADCVATYLSGVECRVSSGPCDTPELCLGDAPLCPPDVLASAGLSCRASTDTACDPEESCDGVSASCPADVTTCAIGDGGTLDGGPAQDGSVERDATVAVDAGVLPVADQGCGCRVARAGAPVPGLFGALFALAVLRMRRRPRR